MLLGLLSQGRTRRLRHPCLSQLARLNQLGYLAEVRGGGGREVSLLGIGKGVDAGRWVCGRDGWEDQPGSHGGGPSLFSIGIFLLNGITAVVSI
jgi:hypothetical protein